MVALCCASGLTSSGVVQRAAGEDRQQKNAIAAAAAGLLSDGSVALDCSTTAYALVPSSGWPASVITNSASQSL